MACGPFADEPIEPYPGKSTDHYRCKEAWGLGWKVNSKDCNEHMTNPKFKAQSRASLQATRQRYARLNNAMVKARSRMEPALAHLRDYVLFLKHNLNAQAVGALGREVQDIEGEVEKLIQDIASSVKEADAFLKTLE